MLTRASKNRRECLYDIRVSRIVDYFVINLAVFTDSYLYGLIVPILPFVLVEFPHLDESHVQRWIGLLLAAYGAGLVIGAREYTLHSSVALSL